VLGLLGFLTQRTWILALTALALFLNWMTDPTHYRWGGRLYATETGVLLPALFFLGAACWIFRDRFQVSALTGWLAVAVLAVGYVFGFWRLPVFFAFPALILAVALRAPVLKLPAWIGDLSYGIYLYAYPVQQILVQEEIGRKAPYLLFLCSLLATLPLACLSWHLVERPALELRRRQFAPPARTVSVGTESLAPRDQGRS
jgi:peptidoglycan/LPS O-acetylase OafA/YrhL